MGFDHLKALSQHATASAVPAERLDTEDVATAPAAPSSVATESPTRPVAPEELLSASSASRAAYFDHWIAQLGALNGRTPEAAQTAWRQALEHAPGHLRPSDGDARLFGMAGASTVPYRAVIDWLHIRKVADIDGGSLAADTAHYWLRRMAAVSRSSADRVTRYRAIAHAAVQAGQGLPPALIEALAAQPDAVEGYLRCAALKTRLGEAAARNDPPSAAADPRPATTTTAATEVPARAGDGVAPSLPAPPLAAHPSGLGEPTIGHSVGRALGQVAGGLFGGAVAGFKSGFDRVRERSVAAATASDDPNPAPGRFWQRWTGVAAQARAQRATQAAARAEQALTAFEAASHRVQQHPRLVAFWQAVDRQAQQSADGQRSTVLRDLSRAPHHPLRVRFERQLAADPDMALWHARAQAAFERVQTVWTQTTQTSMAEGTGWSPTPEQQHRLRAACFAVPPPTDRPALVECAERLLHDLAHLLRQAFQQPCAGGAGSAPST